MVNRMVNLFKRRLGPLWAIHIYNVFAAVFITGVIFPLFGVNAPVLVVVVYLLAGMLIGVTLHNLIVMWSINRDAEQRGFDPLKNTWAGSSISSLDSPE